MPRLSSDELNHVFDEVESDIKEDLKELLSWYDDSDCGDWRNECLYDEGDY
jgi:hypothetical protein